MNVSYSSDLFIVIVNYNTRDLLRDCLQSVYASSGDFTYRVCVVDNASTDGSAVMVQTAFPEALLVASDENLGFARANNRGIRELLSSGEWELRDGQCPTPLAGTLPTIPRYALLLNPDTVLPQTALQEMIAFMDAHPNAGVVGPKLVRQDGSLDLACRRSFPSPEVSAYRLLGLSKLFPQSRRFGRYNMTYLDPDELAEVDAVVGAFMMLRGEIIEQVGLLDEQFFMYAEDLDWCNRIKAVRNPQTGEHWKVYYNPAVTVLHYKRASSQHSRKARFEFYRTMLTFHEKHYAATTPFLFNWLIKAGVVFLGGVAMVREVIKR